MAELEAAGYRRRVLGFRCGLPASETLGSVLAVVVGMAREGRPWRHRLPASLIQARGRAGGQAVRFEPVPGHRQADNGQSAPWIVFRSRLGRGCGGRSLQVALTAYLPADVATEVEIWTVPRWWKTAGA
jgi:hypothetical protein